MKPEIEALVISLIPQANAIAWRRYQKAPHALERDELESLAYMGLMQAAREWPAYCARNGFQESGDGLRYFPAYCQRRMNGIILDYQRSLDWVPRATRQKAKRLAEAGSELGRPVAELAAQAGLTVAEVHATRSALARRPVSLDDGDRDVPDGNGVENTAQVAEILKAVRAAGSSLTRVQRLVLALRYYEQMPLADVAVAVGLDRAVVVQAHDSAVQVVRDAMLTAAA